MFKLDMKNKPCPMPVVAARRALQEHEQVLVIVDNEIAVQNLEKMAKGEGHALSSIAVDGAFEVAIQRHGEDVAFVDAPKAHAAHAIKPFGGLTVMIASDCLGSGSDELGSRLMRGYIFALTELEQPPEHVIFMNGGAKLTTSEASTVPDLKRLAARGSTILTCGTCADYYGLKDALAVGALTDMMNIANITARSARVINL